MQYESPSEPYETRTLPWQSPLVLAEKIKQLGYMIWMDSTIEHNADQAQRYDIITACPEFMVYASGKQLRCLAPDTKKETFITEDPFNYLETLAERYAVGVKGSDIPFAGGLAGYWGYELNSVTEPKCITRRDSIWPDMAVGLYLWSLVADHKMGTLSLFFHPEVTEKKKQSILHVIDRSQTTKEQPLILKAPFYSCMSAEYYQQAFDQIKSYIYAGDCYQVNLTQRFSAPYQGDLWAAYKQLRSKSPTPFSAYLDCGEVTILSHSPERFIKLDQGKIETKPIKGTQPRYSCPVKDKLSAKTLISSEKDKAENLMIVDLLRNDLNRHCKANSVKTTKLFALESYANVHHLVSTIEGKLKKDIGPIQLLKGTFPGGSITGAPKIRAMQIIRELEPEARSAYCGAIGYISFNGNMDTNIPIRTLIGDGQEISCWGGGGIVADSTCEQEYQESKVKVANLTALLESLYLNQVPAKKG